MRAAIYCRVSTDEQTTLNQEIELKEYCLRNSYDIYKIYKDEGVSGSKTSRPQLDQMLIDMRLKSFDAILIWKLDRLGRNTQHLLQLLEEFKNKDIKLIISTMGLDTSTAMGKFFFTVIGSIAELERETIRERIKLGLKRRLNSGKSLGRPVGSIDKKARRKSGYYVRWSK
jgi:DNA invertase Pin-like site-specific DNA recombinase